MIALLRIAIITVLSWLFWRLVKVALGAAISRVARGVSNSASAPDSSAPEQVADMVRDPACGSYVSMDHALVGDFGGKRFYFCSNDCLNTYRAKNRKGPNDPND